MCNTRKCNTKCLPQYYGTIFLPSIILQHLQTYAINLTRIEIVFCQLSSLHRFLNISNTSGESKQAIYSYPYCKRQLFTSPWLIKQLRNLVKNLSERGQKVCCQFKIVFSSLRNKGFPAEFLDPDKTPIFQDPELITLNLPYYFTLLP